MHHISHTITRSGERDYFTYGFNLVGRLNTSSPKHRIHEKKKRLVHCIDANPLGQPHLSHMYSPPKEKIIGNPIQISGRRKIRASCSSRWLHLARKPMPKSPQLACPRCSSLVVGHSCQEFTKQ